MIKKYSYLVCLCIFSISYSGCAKDAGTTTTTVDCSGTTKSFSADVNPVFQSSCNTASCHASGTFNGPGALTSYNTIFANRAQIRSSIASGRMPRGSSLSTSAINTVLCWIDAGAANN